VTRFIKASLSGEEASVGLEAPPLSKPTLHSYQFLPGKKRRKRGKRIKQDGSKKKGAPVCTKDAL
jgi:hypothetical protein